MNREKAWKYMGIFLAVMLLFTGISRAADSFTVAQVRVKSPGKQMMTHTAAGSGTIVGAKERAVFVESGQKIFESYVKAGGYVKKGEILFTVDLDFLQEQIDACKNEEKRQRMANTDAAEQKKQKERQEQAAIQWAEEDYARAREKSAAAVQTAWEERDAAAERLEEYRNTRQDFVNENAVGEEDLTAQLEEELRAKERALEASILENREMEAQAARSLEDAQMAPAKDHTLEMAEMELQEKVEKLERLQKLYEAGGNIYAPADGTVTEILLHAGEVSGEGAALLLAEGGDSCQFLAFVKGEEEDYVTVGSSISLEGTKELEKLKDLSVESIQTAVNENGESVKELTVLLPEGAGKIGQRAEYVVSKEAGNAELCVPLAALHQENQQYFVYVLEENAGILGKEWVARALQVTVEDRNESVAALSSSALSSQAKVIIETDRAIEDGSRVRLMEE